jgi:hypothetical protein
MTVREQSDLQRQDIAIAAAADALLAVCAVQTGTDPFAAELRAISALRQVMAQAREEHNARPLL